MKGKELFEIIGLVYIGIGILFCFFGYRFFKTLITILGLFIGGMVGLGLGGLTGEESGLIIFGLLGAVGGAVLLNTVYNVGIFIIGGAVGGVVYQLIGLLAGHGLHPAIIIILFIVGGIAALKIVKLAIVFGTSLVGATQAVTGLFMMLDTDSILRNYRWSSGRQYNFPALADMGEHGTIMFFCIAIMGIAGILYQYKVAFGIPFSFNHLTGAAKQPVKPKTKGSETITTNKRTERDTQHKVEKKHQDIDKRPKFCPEHGHQNPRNAQFCKDCGYKF